MMNLRTRPVDASDEGFLYQLYRSTRLAELAAFGWGDAQIDAFLGGQFHIREQSYHYQFPDSDHHIILIDEAEEHPIGRIFVCKRGEDLRLVDIALLPEYRNQGLGRRLLEELLARASREGLSVSLHVDPFNPAIRLYERLGFAVVRDTGSHLYMECAPPWAGDGKEREGYE